MEDIKAERKTPFKNPAYSGIFVTLWIVLVYTFWFFFFPQLEGKGKKNTEDIFMKYLLYGLQTNSLILCGSQ